MSIAGDRVLCRTRTALELAPAARLEPAARNLAGYMIYDGPVRIFNDRFVNFKVDPKPLLDATDVTWLNQFSSSNKYVGNKAFTYEGDAALGWFQANPNPYPNATVSNQLVFDNVDLRHQIYTEEVHVGTTFKDSDKNTAILDEDGTLTGLPGY